MPMIARMRLCLTASRDLLVAAGHPDAAFLYAAIGDEIPDEAAARFGLADGLLPGAADESAAEAERIAAEEARAQADATAEAEREAAARAEAAAAEKAEADAAAAKAEADAAAAEKVEADAAAAAKAEADAAAAAKAAGKRTKKAEG